MEIHKKKNPHGRCSLRSPSFIVTDCSSLYVRPLPPPPPAAKSLPPAIVSIQTVWDLVAVLVADCKDAYISTASPLPVNAAYISTANVYLLLPLYKHS